METSIHQLDTSTIGQEPSEGAHPPFESSPDSPAAVDQSTHQLQLSVTLERLRLESAKEERLLEMVRLEQLRVSGNEAAEERRFRAEQAERDRELEKIQRVSHSGEWSSFWSFYLFIYLFIQDILENI